MLGMTTRLFTLVALACCMASGAQAAVVQFEGINDTNPLAGFYIDGTEINGNVLELDVFGSPPDVLPFSVLASATVPAQSMTDTVSLNVIAPDGYYISNIIYLESLKTVVSPNSGSAWAIAEGSITVNGDARTLGSTVYTTATDITFGLGVNYDLSSDKSTLASVMITNSIFAAATGGGEASIAKGYDISGEAVLPRLEVVLQAVPIPAAAWLFGSALLGFAAYGRRKLS